MKRIVIFKLLSTFVRFAPTTQHPPGPNARIFVKVKKKSINLVNLSNIYLYVKMQNLNGKKNSWTTTKVLLNSHEIVNLEFKCCTSTCVLSEKLWATDLWTLIYNCHFSPLYFNWEGKQGLTLYFWVYIWFIKHYIYKHYINILERCQKRLLRIF